MSDRLAAVALATGLLAAGGVSAAAQDQNALRSANLDADPALERVVPDELCLDAGRVRGGPPCAADESSARRIMLEDSCPGRALRRYRLSNVQDSVDRLRIIQADGRGKREVFFVMRSGATARMAYTRLWAFRRRAGEPCPKPRRLFAFPSRRTLGRLPRGAKGRTGSDVRIGNYARRYRGRELKVLESYVDADDAFCRPSFRRTSYFRYSRKRDLYVRYKTRARRVKVRGVTL